MFRLFSPLKENPVSEQKYVKYVGYPPGETILIVIGNLIALQRDNWNQNRKAMAQTAP